MERAGLEREADHPTMQEVAAEATGVLPTALKCLLNEAVATLLLNFSHSSHVTMVGK